jgi:hypothetical protein
MFVCVKKSKSSLHVFVSKKTKQKKFKKILKSKRDLRNPSTTFLSRKNKERERQKKPIEPIEGMSVRGKPIKQVGVTRASAFGVSCEGGVCICLFSWCV